MTTITIPKNLIMEKDLMIISRSKYDSILEYLKIIEDYEHLWKNVTKNKLLKSYSKSDSIYDQV